MTSEKRRRNKKFSAASNFLQNYYIYVYSFANDAVEKQVQCGRLKIPTEHSDIKLDKKLFNSIVRFNKDL